MSSKEEEQTLTPLTIPLPQRREGTGEGNAGVGMFLLLTAYCLLLTAYSPLMWVITETTYGMVIAGRATMARGWRQRAVGLLSRSSLAAGEALIIPRCRAIHTCFMRFPIDVLFLNTNQVEGKGKCLQPPASSFQHGCRGVVIKVVQHMRPFRFTCAPGADTVIELPAGAIAGCRLRKCQTLVVRENVSDTA